MRALIDFLISIYLLPLQINKRLSLYAKGKIFRYDEHFAIALDVIKRKFNQDKSVIVDVGAYDADSAIYLAKHLPENPIIGFEPNPVAFNKGLRRIGVYKNIEIKNLGLSNEKGEMILYITDNQVSSSLYPPSNTTEFRFSETVNVMVDTLDDALGTHNDILLLKLDVQGGELNVLKGGKEVLSKTKLVLTEMNVVDLYKGGCLYYEVDEILRKNNFMLYSIISNYNKDGAKYFDVLYINAAFN